MSFLTDVAEKIAVEAVEVVAKEIVEHFDDEKEIEHVAELGGKHD